MAPFLESPGYWLMGICALGVGFGMGHTVSENKSRTAVYYVINAPSVHRPEEEQAVPKVETGQAGTLSVEMDPVTTVAIYAVTENADLRQQLNAKDEEIRSVREQSSKLSKSLQRSSVINSAYSLIEQDLTSELHETQASVQRMAVEQRAEREYAANTRQDLETKLRQAETTIQKKESELSECVKVKETLARNQCTVVRRQERRMDALLICLKHAQHSLDASEESRTFLENEVSWLTALLEISKDDEKKLQLEINDGRVECALARAEITQLRVAKRQLKDRLDARNLFGEEQQASWDTERRALMDRNQSLNRSLEKASRVAAEMKNTQVVMSGTLYEQCKRITWMEEQASDYLGRELELLFEQEDLEANVQCLSDRLRTATEERDTLQRQQGTSEKQVSELHCQLDAAERQRGALVAEIHRRGSCASVLALCLQRSENTVDINRHQTDKLRSRMRRELRVVCDIVTRQKRQYERLQQKLTQAKKQLRICTGANKRLSISKRAIEGRLEAELDERSRVEVELEKSKGSVVDIARNNVALSLSGARTRLQLHKLQLVYMRLLEKNRKLSHAKLALLTALGSSDKHVSALRQDQAHHSKVLGQLGCENAMLRTDIRTISRAFCKSELECQAIRRESAEVREAVMVLIQDRGRLENEVCELKEMRRDEIQWSIRIAENCEERIASIKAERSKDFSTIQYLQDEVADLTALNHQVS